MLLKIKVVPGAKTSEVVGWYGEQLKMRVSQPPEKGKANRAVIGLLASTLNVPTTSIEIVSGHSSPNKIVKIADLAEEEIFLALKFIVN